MSCRYCFSCVWFDVDGISFEQGFWLVCVIVQTGAAALHGVIVLHEEILCI